MILVLFFLSGFTALLYEVVWERLLHVVFGLSTYAVTVVTAAFMLGLALGYLAGQSRRLSRYHPFVVYGLAEGLIGVFALIFPFLLKIIDMAYVASGGSFALQIVLSLLALSLPATLMGLTLPTLARQVAQEGRIGRRVGLLYAINTTGAVLGAFFAGVFFIRTYGVFQTTLIATAINAAICLVALTQPRRPVKQSDRPAEQARTHGAGFSTPGQAALFSVYHRLYGPRAADHLGADPDLCGVEQHLFFLGCAGRHPDGTGTGSVAVCRLRAVPRQPADQGPGVSPSCKPLGRAPFSFRWGCSTSSTM